MKKAVFRLLFLSVIMLVVLSACNLPLDQAVSGGAPSGDAQALVGLAGPQVGTTMRWYDNNMLVYVPAGEFPMGVRAAPSDLGDEGDNPLHTVFLDGFWIYRYKVTNGMYRLCVTVGVCTPPKDQAALSGYNDPQQKDHPVVGVDWAQAQAYCEWMDARLPSEAEWEKTARGPGGNIYPWGEEAPTCNLLNYGECVGHTGNVFDFPDGMSAYEAYDMAGNAFEWVADWYDRDYYLRSPASAPPGPESGQTRVVRASSFKSRSDQLPSAGRFFLEPDSYREDLGFRCVPTGEGYAPFCQLTAYIPAGPGAGPGEPPPGGGAGPDREEPPGCEPPAPSLDSVNYCANQGAQLGGANVTFEGSLGGRPAECDEDDNPMVCVGPENTTIEVPVCTSCDPPPGEPVRFDPVCDPGYVLVKPDGLAWCVFEGAPAEPGGACPVGFFYDADADICVRGGKEPAEDCSEGYTYNNDSQCCSADFAAPGNGNGGIPDNVYPGCPVGFFYHPVFEQCVAGPADGGPPVTTCDTFEVVLGNCADPGGGETQGCQPPGGGCGGSTPVWCAPRCACVSVTAPCP